MKKLLSLLVFAMLCAGCEIGVRPAPIAAVHTVSTYGVCEADPYDVYWTSYCDGACCYEEYYDGGWLCEQAWCYDYYYCQWEYMGEICH